MRHHPIVFRNFEATFEPFNTILAMKKLLLSIIAIVAIATGTRAQEENMNTTPLSFEAVEDNTEITITSKQEGSVLRIELTSGPSTSTFSAATPYKQTLPKGYVLSVRNFDTAFSDNYYITASKDVYVYGNALSLISRTFSELTDLTGCPNGVLQEVFRIGWEGNPHIKDHPTKDIVLPATTLSDGCYKGMFQGTGLTRAPQLPAMTLAYRCYDYMFFGCKSLTEAPALPATTLADECYYAMFYGCTALTEAPALPATTLKYSCYGNMFRDCISLTSAPELLAPVLADDCYYWMFYGCKNLTYVKCLATDISASSCTNNFLGNVSPTGTFVKADGMDDWTRDYNGVPEGWTIINASEETTAIGEIENGKTNLYNNNVYDLQGRRMLSHLTPLKKGVYIVNGKKTVIR